MPPPAHVLIVEDEAGIARPMAEGLAAEGHAVQVEASAEGGLAALAAGAGRGLAAPRGTAWDLLVLDLMLPGGRSGFDLLDRVRRHHPTTLVLVVTARDALEDRLRGLRDGADDYLAKPFAQAELLARVQALLRRSRALPQARLTLADVALDALARRATRGGVALELTALEFELLHLLLRHAGRTVSRDMLARELWQGAPRATPLDNVIDVHVAHLRRKLEEGGRPRLVHTVRGVGFVAAPHEP
jgi:DNA-binding response OmpR family regulator